MERITSRSNPRIKALRALADRKGREAAGAFLVEGIHAVGQAVEAGAEIQTLCYAPDLLTSDYARNLIERHTGHGGSCIEVSTDVFASVAEKENPQGLLAAVRKRNTDLNTLNPKSFPWGVALVSPQDPGNVGTILRTIDSCGASGLILLEQSVDETHPSAVRASMGAIFWLPVVRTTFDEFNTWAGGHGYAVVGTSARADTHYEDVPAYAPPLILLMGSEREGLNSEQRAACTRLVGMPMHGRITSLNLAVATGIMLYDILRKLTG